MVKTSKAQFEKFKKECEKWIRFFGLIEWDVIFQHANLEDGYGDCKGNYSGRVARIRLAKEIPSDTPPERIKQTAFHEVCELLLSDMCAISSARYINKDEEEVARHTLIRRLENSVYKALKENDNVRH